MEVKNAIEILQESKRENEIMRDNPTIFWRSIDMEAGIQNAQRRIEAINTALTALRSMQEAGEPLTVERLREMDGKPVWIVEYPDWGHWELSEDANDYIVDRNLDFYGMKHDDPDGRYGLHKLGWLAYPYPPTHIDRSEWTAEWVPMTDDDGCVWLECSACEYDLDSLEEPHPFCPSCGRAMMPEAWAELERRLKMPEPPEEG